METIEARLGKRQGVILMRTVFARGGGVDHWVAPLRARVEGLKSLKQLSEVRLLHPLMLRQALKVVQHVCVHPVISALGLDTIAALHAELQDWKSLLQTRTLWLPALQGDCAGLID